MSLYIPKRKIPPVLFEKIGEVHTLAKKIETQKKSTVLYHLTSRFEAYYYVFYVAIVDKILKKNQGKIVDWGGFVGQVTILMRSLGYDCDNAVLEYPSTKKDFEKFQIPYVIIKNPKKLPYDDNSVLAVISSGVLEHVHENNLSEQEAVAEIYRILQPGGYFFCWNLPRKYAVVEQLAKIHHTSCHSRLYTKKQVMHLLKNQGFHIQHIEKSSGILTLKGIRSLLSFFDPWNQFMLDYYISKIPPFCWFSHHFTIIAQKPSCEKSL